MLELILTPRECEHVTAEKPAQKVNSALLAVIQGKLDDIRGELTLTEEELEACRLAAANWRGGHERAFQAIVRAADRHGD